LWDSTLGFRHGPKAFVTDGTDITVFTSPDTPTSRYDADLAAELRTQFPYASVETIGAGGDIDIAMPFGAAWAAPLCVASAQVRGVVWSHNLGLNVDDPFSGQSTLSRVVSGVKLYPVAS
jgi:tagatose-6-phosphate ketose/aldose isomerase